MNANLSKEKVMKCFHCGNETLMHQNGEYKWGSNDDYCFEYTYKMFSCPVCHKITLLETYGDEDMINYGIPDCQTLTHYTEDTILFPISNIDSNSIPPKVKEAFGAALKTKNIDKYVALIALRRALELTLKDKGATKRSLKEKIEEIANKGLLPDALKEASSITRMFGNSAAHDNDLEIHQHDVDSMAEFVEYIIEYLYVIPDKINSYTSRSSSKENN